VGWIW